MTPPPTSPDAPQSADVPGPAAVVALLTEQGVATAPPPPAPRRRLVVNVVAMTGVRIAGQAVALFTSAYVSRVFGPSLMGSIGWNQAVLNYAALLANPGMATIATRDVAGAADRGTEIFVSRTVVQLLLGLPIVAVVIALAWWRMADGRQALFMTIQAAGILVGVLNIAWLFDGHERMVLSNVLTLAVAVVQVPLLVWLVHTHADMVTYLAMIYPLQLAAWAVLGVVAFRSGLLRRDRLHWASVSVWRLFKEAMPITLSTAAVLLFYNCDAVILGLHFPAATVGLYQRAFALMLLNGSVIGAVSSAFAPRLARVVDDPAAAAALSLRLLQLLTLAGTLFFAFGFCFGRQFTVLIYAAEFAPAGPVFEWLAVTPVLIGINTALVTPFNVWGRQTLMLRVTLAAAAFNLVANLLLLPKYGMWAAVWTTIGAEGVVLVLAAVARRRVVPLAIARPVLRVVTPYLVAVALVKTAVSAGLLPWPILFVLAAGLYASIAAWLEWPAIAGAWRGVRGRPAGPAVGKV